MSGVDLGPAPERVEVDAGQVRRLVAGQFPRWAGLPVRPVARGGWDNRTFHLGDDMSVRLPSAAEYAEAVDKEHRWLPVLAPRLPLPIPVPLAKGSPTAEYPFPWSVYRWLDGRPAAFDRVAEPMRFALDLAEFLAALRAVPTDGGPRPGVHNWFRGGSLRTFDGLAQAALDTLTGSAPGSFPAPAASAPTPPRPTAVPPGATGSPASRHYLPPSLGRDGLGRAREIWQEALDARWDGARSWFHGDVAEGNLLLDDAGQLAAVIDFGTCGIGDPSCDLAVAWTLLTGDARLAFRERLEVDDAGWARGRGWALWKTLTNCAHAVDRDDDAWRVLTEILLEAR